MASIYLIRHGQASFGSENYDRLSELGCRQAEVLGGYLQTCGLEFDAVYSGELERQRKTAEIATGGMVDASRHIVDARFNEVDNDAQVRHLLPPLLEGDAALKEIAERAFATHSSKDYQKIIERVFNRWVELGVDPGAGEFEGLQSWADYSAGTRDALAEIMQREGGGKRIAVFSSGGTIATIVAQVLGLSGAQTYAFYEPMVNCSITCLLYNRSKASVSYYNDHSFLDLLGRQRGESLVSYR
jgi:broad specificity phosphatase PhoE